MFAVGVFAYFLVFSEDSSLIVIAITQQNLGGFMIKKNVHFRVSVLYACNTSQLSKSIALTLFEKVFYLVINLVVEVF